MKPVKKLAIFAHLLTLSSGQSLVLNFFTLSIDLLKKLPNFDIITTQKQFLLTYFFLVVNRFFQKLLYYIYPNIPNIRNAPINAKLMSELDAKIDDGRPWTGRLVGIKTIYGYLNTDKEVCYDSNGLYLNQTASKNGCNLIKVMEDVK
jgi:hypothetical protein